MDNRRQFLKGALASGAAVTAAVATGEACARETRSRPPEALGLLYDSTLCVGCKILRVSLQAGQRQPAEFSGPRVLWDNPLDTSGHLQPYPVYRNGSMLKRMPKDGYAFMKTSCMHCADPSCVSACPVSAMTKDPVTGVVGYNPDSASAAATAWLPARLASQVPVRFTYGAIGKCQLCRHRRLDGHYSACAEVSAHGEPTLFGRTEDLLEGRPAPPGHETGELNLSRADACPPRPKKEAKAQGKTLKPRGARRRPDQSYETPAGKYLQHVYGEKEYGAPGTQACRRGFPKLGMPTCPRMRLPPVRNHPAHAVRQHGAALCGAGRYEFRGTTQHKENRRRPGGHVMSTLQHAAPAPVGGRLLNAATFTCGVLIALALAVLAARFLFGLGAVTALNDGYPWGIWVVFDVVIGSAFACGGFSVAMLVYIFNRGEYHPPLVRPACWPACLATPWPVSACSSTWAVPGTRGTCSGPARPTRLGDVRGGPVHLALHHRHVAGVLARLPGADGQARHQAKSSTRSCSS